MGPNTGAVEAMGFQISPTLVAQSLFKVSQKCLKSKRLRFWLQLIIKNVLTVILCHISSIVTLTADDWVLGDVMCHGLGVMHIYFLVCTFSMLCVMHFYQVC